MSPRVLGTFSGVGGFELAFTRAYAEVVGVSEIDKNANAVLAHQFPDVPNLGDIERLDTDDLPEFDVLTGGFPCQDVSVAGRRAGLDGKRTGLFFELLRILDARRPRWFVFENVPGLLSSNGGADFARVLYEMGQLGYGIAWRILDAQFLGVPQRRRRVFIVGHLGHATRAAAVLLEREGGNWNPPARRASRPQVADAAGPGAQNGSVALPVTETTSALQAGKGGLRLDADSAAGGQYITVGVSVYGELAHTLTRAASKGTTEDGCGRGVPIVPVALGPGYSTPLQSTHRGVPSAEELATRPGAEWGGQAIVMGQCVSGDITHTLKCEGHDGSEDGTGRGQPMVPVANAYMTGRGWWNDGEGVGGTLAARDYKDAGQVVVESVPFRKSKRAQTNQDDETWQAGDGYANTLSQFDSGETRAVELIVEIGGVPYEIDPASLRVRRLTPMECERLQGFPDGWTDVPLRTLKNGKVKRTSDSARYAAMGNAVAVPVVSWIARRLLEVDAR